MMPSVQARNAQVWHALTAAVALASIVVELVMVANGHNPLLATDLPPASTRVIRFFSYFTIESNLLVAATSAMLAAQPGRDGLLFRMLRLDALFGITVTLVVYSVLLAPQHDPNGINAWTNAGLHYIAPAMTILGWLAFGPRPRIDENVLLSPSSGRRCMSRTRSPMERRATGTRTRSSTPRISVTRPRCATGLA